MTYIQLYTQSHYSFLRGLDSPKALAARAAAAGMPALALTDFQSMTGMIEFYDACIELGIQPILGLEIKIASPNLSGKPGSSILLYAIDLSGYANLCRLVYKAQAFGDNLPIDNLDENADGLICVCLCNPEISASARTPGDNSTLSSLLHALNHLFPDRFYLGLLYHADLADNVNLTLKAKKLNLPTIAIHQLSYLQPDQAHLQRLVSAIRLNRTVKHLSSEDIAPVEAHFLTSEEFSARFSSFPSAIQATYELADRCRLTLPVGKPHYPDLNLPPGVTAMEVLSKKAHHGVERYYKISELPQCERQEIMSRLDHELSVIQQCGYAPLFLIMEEILSFTRRQGIPTASRGSASSSLVAHCLGITSPDPIRLNLYFERFLNPARATPPDIDTDLCSRRRDEVIHFVSERFGNERVAMVCTINRFRHRSALREVAKAHGLSPQQVSSLSESLPHRWYRPGGSQTETPYVELINRYQDPINQAIFQDAAAIINLPDHLSVHPGGVVIAPGELTDLSPKQPAAKGVPITQYDLESIERLGLVKIDLLGIRGLSVLGDVAQAIARDKAQSTNTVDILESIPLVDPLTSKTIQEGRTIGCFQIESPGMRATLREIEARSVDDLMVALALYRPGPLTGGLKDAFVRRHLGKEQPSQLHPALSNLLSDTYGVILYQEQVLRIAHELAGLSLSDADLLRRAMSHFDPGKQMQTLKEKFIAGAAQRNQVPPAIAEHIWELMAAFAGYGFPKAHSASYAVVAWRAAWCKTHFPAIFMASVLANWGGFYSQRVYITEARRLGLKIHPPHINYAGQEFSITYLEDKPELFMGLNQVKELTQRTIQQIISRRPFTSFADFLARVDPRQIEAENLIRSGALEGFGAIPGLLQQFSHGWRVGQMPLFSFEKDNLEDWTINEKVAAQEAILGMGIDAHPLELAAPKLAKSQALTTLDAIAHQGERVAVAGMRQTWRRSMADDGDYLYTMVLEDLEGTLSVIINQDIYRRYKNALKTPGPYIVEGRVALDRMNAELFLLAEKIETV